MKSLLALLMILMSFQVVSMTEVDPYEIKNKNNLERLIVRTRIPVTLKGKERKVAYLKALAERVASVGENILVGNGAEKLIARTVSEVKRDESDIQAAISALKAKEEAEKVAISTKPADTTPSPSLEERAKEILKKYKTKDRPMDKREVNEVRNWLFTQPNAAWWYKPETRSPMQLCKSVVNKVYVWPSDFNFPKMLMQHENDVTAARVQMFGQLNTGLSALNSRRNSDIRKIKGEWQMRMTLVEKFTADTTDVGEIADRLDAFERIVLTLLTNTEPDLIVNAGGVLKKWLLTNQMMYAIDGISGKKELVNSWEGDFPVSNFTLPIQREAIVTFDDEIEVDTSKTAATVAKRQERWKILQKKVRNGEITKETVKEGAEVQSNTSASTSNTSTSQSAPKKGWFWL